METTTKDKKKFDKKEYKRQWALKNRERLEIHYAEYRKNNKEKIADGKKIYYKNNKDKVSKDRKKWYERNVEYVKEYCKEKYLNDKEIIKMRSNSYYHNNQKVCTKRNVEYRKRRIQNDPIFKMVCNLRTRIYHSLKSQGAKKDIKTKELFGASQEFVWKHLESQFKKGMTKENHGPKGWHIDHIKPMSSFDLSNPEQLKECCHYTNLQPLWWFENLEKSDKLDYESKDRAMHHNL